MAQYKIAMVRHGESEWNQKNLFCGWYDSNLSDKGKEEAIFAGKALKDAGFKLDMAFTSLLTRAHETLQTILEQTGQTDIQVTKTWRLNERHYGSLTGLNKAETAIKYGEEQVDIWRRSFDIPPPPMKANHLYYEEIATNLRYTDSLSSKEFPKSESLKMTLERTLPFWNDVVAPQIKAGKSILIVAHGDSLRGIIKYLDNLSNKAIVGLNLPTGIPFVYALDENLKPTPNGSLEFLGNSETVKTAIEAVAGQRKAT